MPNCSAFSSHFAVPIKTCIFLHTGVYLQSKNVIKYTYGRCIFHALDEFIILYKSFGDQKTNKKSRSKANFKVHHQLPKKVQQLFLLLSLLQVVCMRETQVCCTWDVQRATAIFSRLHVNNSLFSEYVKAYSSI